MWPAYCGPRADRRVIGAGREGIKSRLSELNPDAKPRSIAGQAGVLVRFRDEMQIGDVIVAPFKPNSTINIGIVTSAYYFEAAATVHRHRRKVEWKKLGLPRTVFAQSATQLTTPMTNRERLVLSVTSATWFWRHSTSG